MDDDGQPCPSPYQPTSLLKDISNFRTPRRPLRNPNFQSPCPQFFTASKQTPRSTSSFSRPSLAPSSSSARSKVAAARRLRAFELEQSQSSRKAQTKKEQRLKSLAKSLTVWLNFLFENPRSCGCDLSFNGDSGGGASDVGPMGKGKRDSGGTEGCTVDVERAWRSPKRFRDLWWRGKEPDTAVPFSSSKYSTLRSSLKDVCSLDDLIQRLQVYLSLACCKDILDVMNQVTKNIDDGRIKMKQHCPIVTDVGMKNKAVNILMCYNPIWLRIGLYIILGGDSLMSDADANSEQEIAFLKMVIEKQCFSHAGLAKAYAYNRMVEGLYRPGYYETLGSIILKRILLLVLILDRAKSQSSLPITYGIDGVDGGSPLLFAVQSSIKSSGQMIHDFLSSDVMHGEGNLLAHLVIVGYKVPYQQCPLIEFDFRVTDLFVDLQDGVRLCRAVYLLQHDPSILMKTVVPSDTRKKYLANCGIALKCLMKAGVELHDDDGMMIVGDDIANGDKELTLSMLWNMFVHLQLPLLIRRTIILEEICKIRGLDVNQLSNVNSTPSEMLLNWIKAICEKYDYKIDKFSSLADGKAVWCLLDYYFRRELCCSCLPKEDSHETRGEQSIVSVTDYTNAVHNFILSQKLTALLGNFPEVLQISDLLEHSGAISDQSVIILLAFLSSQLTVKENMDQLNFHKLLCHNCQAPERRHSRNGRQFVSSGTATNKEEINGNDTEDAAKRFKAIQAWWQEMTAKHCNYVMKPATSTRQCFLTSKHIINIQKENAAKVIQSHVRRFLDYKNFKKTRNAVCFLQTVIQAWLQVKQKSRLYKFSVVTVQELSYGRFKNSETLTRYIQYIVDRHNFINLRRSVLHIQRVARIWIARKHQGRTILKHDISTLDQISASIIVQKHIRGWIVRSGHITRVAQMRKASVICQEKGLSDREVEAAAKIQLFWKIFSFHKSFSNQILAANKIQSHVRGWLLRRRFLDKQQAIIKIQSNYRCLRCLRAFQQHRYEIRSAIVIQAHVRGWITRRGAWRYRYLISVIQRHCRGWLVRRDFLMQRAAAIKIQSIIRCLISWRTFHCRRHAAIEIQRFFRGQIVRKRLLGASSFCAVISSDKKFHISRRSSQNFDLKMVLSSVVKIQRWWKDVMSLRLRTRSAIIIQSHIRGWIARQHASRERHRIIVIQSYWKGYLARKDSKAELLNLRLRMQKSATDMDDNKRIINRLVSAVSELWSMRSVRGILHICATLDMATANSQKCCEELIAAGAIDILLKLIHSASRSIPDQEVLKHSLSTLRNLARYPHLIEVLITSHRSLEIISWELLRNKEESYFIACEILKKICLNSKGIEAVHRLTTLLKRLHSLVEELTRKANAEKRNTRVLAARENTERRLKEAVELLKLIAAG